MVSGVVGGCEEGGARDIPINGLVVTLGGDDLRCKVVGRTTKCPSNVWHFLCESEIGDLDVTVPVEQQVFRLQVAVDDVQGV